MLSIGCQNNMLNIGCQKIKKNVCITKSLVWGKLVGKSCFWIARGKLLLKGTLRLLKSKTLFYQLFRFKQLVTCKIVNVKKYLIFKL